MGFPPADPRQLPHQGAILCRDWPGPLQWRKSIPQDFYFAADDLSEEASLSGLVIFLFCCYGAGTPSSDDFAQQAFRQTAAIAPHAFLAHLPQRLLAHPRGGALAVVGHVDRAWTYSFSWPRIGEQLDVFESALSVVLRGAPLGFALEFFNDRYAALTTQIEEEKESIEHGKAPDDLMLAGLWTAKNDARNYVIIGDPALRLFPPLDAAMLRPRGAARPITVRSCSS